MTENVECSFKIKAEATTIAKVTATVSPSRQRRKGGERQEEKRKGETFSKDGSDDNGSENKRETKREIGRG